MLTDHLYNYAAFFERILYRVSKDYLKENVTIVELRHILGNIFDEEGFLSVERELEIFHRVQKNI